MPLRKNLKKLQMRFLPPSSRSFHSATYDIRYDVSQLRQEIARLQEQLNRQSNRLNERIDALSSDIAIHDTHMKLYGDVFSDRKMKRPMKCENVFSILFQRLTNRFGHSSSATANCFTN